MGGVSQIGGEQLHMGAEVVIHKHRYRYLLDGGSEGGDDGVIWFVNLGRI